MNGSHNTPTTRRDLLKTAGTGFGYLALAGFCGTNSALAATGDSDANLLAPKKSHFAPRAQRVIMLTMRGAPSHVDTLDYKPKLTADDGKPGLSRRGGAPLLGSPWKFNQHGKSGLYISELLPNIARHADDLCIINSMRTDLPNHPQAYLQLHTGSFQFVRPSFGAWTLYGLGTENENLPGFVTISPTAANGGAQNYGSSFLPAVYQGTPLGREGVAQRFRQQRGNRGDRGAAAEAIPNIRNDSLSTRHQRLQLDFVNRMNELKSRTAGPDSDEFDSVIQSFELAFRMQDEIPKVMDLAGESPTTLERYGVGQGTTDNFGRQCLIARRLAEAGVRFIEINAGNWDQHRNLRAALAQNCEQIDRPIAALIGDLKQRRLLDDTLVIWGGEFGRTPHAQNGDGRDHNNKGYSMFMAGGGTKGGINHGATDEYGYEAVENPMHVHDLHATVLHLLGLNHEKLTFNYAGRDFRLTDVHGNVHHEIIA